MSQGIRYHKIPSIGRGVEITSGLPRSENYRLSGKNAKYDLEIVTS